MDKQTIDNLIVTFKDNIVKVDQIVNIGNDVTEIVLASLKNLKDEYEVINRPIYNKLGHYIISLENIRNNESLKEKYSVIYNQALVLIVANFESFLNDLFKLCVNDYSYLINWKDNKIGIDLKTFLYSKPTIGDLIVQAYRDKYNFQDLQSTKKFLEDMLDIKNALDSEEEAKIIIYQAMRHVIIHNAAKVDTKFLHQIRDTNYKYSYNDNDLISLNDEQYKEAKKVFEKFAQEIINKLKDKIN